MPGWGQAQDGWHLVPLHRDVFLRPGQEQLGWDEMLSLSRAKQRWVKQKGQAEGCARVGGCSLTADTGMGGTGNAGLVLAAGTVPSRGHACCGEEAVSPLRAELRHNMGTTLRCAGLFPQVFFLPAPLHGLHRRGGHSGLPQPAAPPGRASGHL